LTKKGISNLTIFLKDLAESFNTALDPKNLKMSAVEIYGDT